MALAAVVYGDRATKDAVAAGALTLSGDRRLFMRFVRWFPLSEKIA